MLQHCPSVAFRFKHKSQSWTLKAWFAVSGPVWPNWGVFNTPGSGPAAVYILAMFTSLTSQPWRQGQTSIPGKLQGSALPLPPPPTWGRALAGGQRGSKGGGNTAYFCLPHILHFLHKCSIPHGKEAAEFHLWGRKWAFKQTQTCDICRDLVNENSNTSNQWVEDGAQKVATNLGKKVDTPHPSPYYTLK